MRIRKRWPSLLNLTLPPRPALAPSPPDLQSSTLQSFPSSKSQPLHHHRNFQLNKDLRRPSPNQSPRSLKADEDRRLPDLQLSAVSRTNDHGVLDEKKPHQYCFPPRLNQDPPPVGVGEEECAAEEIRADTTNRRIGSNPGAETSAGSSISSSLSHQGHWCEEDKDFPLKKRRVSFTSKASTGTIIDRETKNMNAGEKRSNKKRVDDDVVEKDSGGKKRESGGKIILELGSRCSRMNGRGWRCSQPTMVGYSLCEHHLGNNRQRSMNRGRRRSAPNDKLMAMTVLDTSLYEDETDNDNGDEKGLMVGRKRKKIGVVKARSISSLLSETVPSTLPVVTDLQILSTDNSSTSVIT